MALNVDLKSLISAHTKFRDVPTDAELKELVKLCKRGLGSAETSLLEMKDRFEDDLDAWLALEKQLVAFNNSGGGIIIFGVPDKKGGAHGLAKSLTRIFDSSVIIPKLQKHAPNVDIPTTYLELKYYGKLYGFLIIGSNGQIAIFDKVGNKPRDGGKGQETVLRPGAVYVRGEGRSVEAKQADLDKLVAEVVAEGLTSFLARIERVASLPSDSELLVRQPGSDRAYILVSAGKGVPVDINASADSSAVPLTEVLTPDLPMSSLDAEVVAQLRQWNTDPRHRVGRSALARWYLGRDQILMIPEAAEFCLRSAVHDHGFSMFWASFVPPKQLELLITTDFVCKYPDWQAVPYLIGTFFFDRRAELVDSFTSPLPRSMDAIVERLLDAPSQTAYFRMAKGTTARLVLQETTYDLDSLADNRDLAMGVFEKLVQMEDEGNLPSSTIRLIAHRLDITLHHGLNDHDVAAAAVD